MLFKTSQGTFKVEFLLEDHGVEYGYKADMGDGVYIFKDGTVIESAEGDNPNSLAQEYAKELSMK